MRKLKAFNFATINGLYAGPQEDISWHKQGEGEEEKEFAAENSKSGNTLVFGRITYEMMAGYWPTEMAAKRNPVVADQMNKGEKIVFSKTLKKTSWNNTTLIKDDILSEMTKLKKMKGPDMTILGSGSLVAFFAEHRLLDEYGIMLDPVALGDGKPLFRGVKNQVDLKLLRTKIFKSGSVFLNYQIV